MPQAVRRRQTRPLPDLRVGQRLRESLLIAHGVAALFLLIALASFDPADPAWSHTATLRLPQNAAGIAGAYLADVLLYLCGALAFLFPFLLIHSGLQWYAATPQAAAVRPNLTLALRTLGLLTFVSVGDGIAWAFVEGLEGWPQGAGGVLGWAVGTVLLEMAGPLGGTLLMVALLLVGWTLYTGLSWLWVMDTVGFHTLRLHALAVERGYAWWQGRQTRLVRRERMKVLREERDRLDDRPRIAVHEPAPRPEPGTRRQQERQASLLPPAPGTGLPPLELLDVPPPPQSTQSAESLQILSRLVELKLKDFGVEVRVVGVNPGPVVTRFELEPAAGVKVSRIVGLAKDLARSLSVVSVRVVEVIPGKSVIGLEIPNERRELVALSEILAAREFEANASPLALALGKDISGVPVVVDLARMPHLLVAGTTGSGKSVALNAMILSLLYKAPPRDVRLIMIDPKMLELSVYDAIPALLAPVVTDMKEAANALRWCVVEMERRYRLMASVGVRNLAGFNRKVADASNSGAPMVDPLSPTWPDDSPRYLEHLPHLVVVVDELADMMMTVGKKVEELIARLAQKARAAGIHLILATQRPSVDVITGLIKANIPSRIAFQVSSRIDSRTILDQSGAEALLGHGDMLYLPPGSGLPVRVHGAFVSDSDVHRVADYLRASGTPDYVEAVVAGADEGSEAGAGEGGGADTGESDPLYDEAVKIITESRRASVSGVQRRLKIGYNRAARLVEVMEKAGIVGPLQSNGAREVLAPPPP
jgi:DNA segregation ATPase FtsK/SpoIIIE, S-DNA-T family